MTTKPESSQRSATRRIVAASSAMLALGIAAGLIWMWLAEPARWEVRDNGVVLTQAASQGQFSVILVFVAVGMAASFLWACGVSWALSDLGWLLVPVVVVLTALAAVLAWRVGVELGPPSPGSVSGVEVGDRIPARLEVDGLAPFLAWPIAGLAGVVGSTWIKGRLRG